MATTTSYLDRGSDAFLLPPTAMCTSSIKRKRASMVSFQPELKTAETQQANNDNRSSVSSDGNVEDAILSLSDSEEYTKTHLRRRRCTTTVRELRRVYLQSVARERRAATLIAEPNPWESRIASSTSKPWGSRLVPRSPTIGNSQCGMNSILEPFHPLVGPTKPKLSICTKF